MISISWLHLTFDLYTYKYIQQHFYTGYKAQKEEGGGEGRDKTGRIERKNQRKEEDKLLWEQVGFEILFERGYHVETPLVMAGILF